MSDDTRTRFLAAIAAKVGADRVEEAHVFAPIRQGGIESGIAVVAVRANGSVAGGHPDPSGDPGLSDPQLADPELTPPHGDPLRDEIAGDGADSSVEPEADEPKISPDDRVRAHSRLTVYSAKYRLTLKGPDRGKWEFAMQAEADAPLLTVETVVRGVQRRSGDLEDPEKLTGDEFRDGVSADGSPA